MRLIRQAAKTLMARCVPTRWLLTQGRPRPAAPRLALTFDDGPHPEHTPRILDLLQTAGARATFFVIGELAARHPDLIRRIAEEGHELGNHTWMHSEPSRTSARQFQTEVQQTDAYLANLTGQVPRAMRPPKGELNWAKLCGLWGRGKTVALWNVDPRDYRLRSADEIATWVSHYTPCDGDVLLFHDNHGWAAIALDLLAKRHVFERFATVTVSELTGNSRLGTASQVLSPLITSRG